MKVIGRLGNPWAPAVAETITLAIAMNTTAAHPDRTCITLSP
jgi:hypothetical protein